MRMLVLAAAVMAMGCGGPSADEGPEQAESAMASASGPEWLPPSPGSRPYGRSVQACTLLANLLGPRDGEGIVVSLLNAPSCGAAENECDNVFTSEADAHLCKCLLQACKVGCTYGASCPRYVHVFGH